MNDDTSRIEDRVAKVLHGRVLLRVILGGPGFDGLVTCVEGLLNDSGFDTTGDRKGNAADLGEVANTVLDEGRHFEGVFGFWNLGVDVGARSKMGRGGRERRQCLFVLEFPGAFPLV